MDRDQLADYAGREQAFVKHSLLESYLERLIMITGQTGYKRIAYVDAFAGPWQSSKEDLSDTSFAKALQVMKNCRTALAKNFSRDVRFRALFVENDPGSYQRLRQFSTSNATEWIEVYAEHRDFVASIDWIAQWIRPDEIAFVLIDPKGWKDFIFPVKLAPLLKMRNVEVLINMMMNFIKLATGHENQQKNLVDLLGENYLAARNADGSWNDRKAMQLYLEQCREIAGDRNLPSRFRATGFPVEFKDRERVFYYLIYGTHHRKGLLVFLERCERTSQIQKGMKVHVRLQKLETKTGTRDIFGVDLNDDIPVEWISESDARQQWLALLPQPGSEAYIDEERMADLAEKCGCLISDLQTALLHLISDGIVRNLDARGRRTRHAVHYEIGETLHRLK